MLGVSPSSTPQEREGKATYDRYEVRLQAVQVQGVWRCRRVLRRTRGGSGRRGLGAAPQQWVPVSPVWAPGQDRTGHGAPPLARRPHRGRTVWLYHRPREIRCPTHGRHVEEVPWAAPSARVSYRFEYLLLTYCQWMPQVVAARLLGLAPSTLSDQLHRLIERRRTGHRIRALTTLGIDEISYAKGHKYATLVYDLEVPVSSGSARARPAKRSIRSSGTISAPSGVSAVRTASAGPAAI